MNRSIVSEAHHLSDAARIAAVGLIGTRGQEALCMPGLNADDLKPTLNQCAVKPFGKRTSFDSDENDLSRQGESTFTNGTGSLSALPSHTDEPSASTTQIDVILSETSSPTYRA